MPKKISNEREKEKIVRSVSSNQNADRLRELNPRGRSTSAAMGEYKPTKGRRKRIGNYA